MVDKLQEKDWDLILDRIEVQRCTPFLGAEVFEGVLPSSRALAKKWAHEYHYPIRGYEDDLVHVAQFIAVHKDELFLKTLIANELRVEKPVDFEMPDEPHGVLAGLPVAVYITTNFNNLLIKALESHGKKPKIEICRWQDMPSYSYPPSVFKKNRAFKPSVDEPIVYFAHGYEEFPESIVVTEDDYLDFLVHISRRESKIPPQIQSAIHGNTLLFLGYRPMDWSFRSILRGLLNPKSPSLRKLSVTVQIPLEPEGDDDLTPIQAQRYLEEYFSGLSIKAYWGTTKEFITDLHQRWKARPHEPHKSD